MVRRSLVFATSLVLAACSTSGQPAPMPVPLSGEAVMIVPSEHAPVLQAQRTGTGPPLAFVGGGLTGWASWEPHQQRLAASREVARLQPLSVQYGLEDLELPEAYSVRMESRALAAALDELGWREPLDLVAWSFGALISLDFALENPHRVRTLTLIEPPAFWVLPDHGREDPEVRRLEPLLRSLRGEITEAQLEEWARAVGLIPPAATAQALPQWRLWMEHRRSLRNSAAPLSHSDELSRLASFPRPVLLVTGTGTPLWLRRITDTLDAWFPHVRILEMPAGHAPQLVSIERFLQELAAFHARSEP
jgi:pimeloyl-ACP methyl ester carboxylesterase